MIIKAGKAHKGKAWEEVNVSQARRLDEAGFTVAVDEEEYKMYGMKKQISKFLAKEENQIRRMLSHG